jgi:superoxide dismutase, Cu-Zn family
LQFEYPASELDFAASSTIAQLRPILNTAPSGCLVEELDSCLIDVDRQDIVVTWVSHFNLKKRRLVMNKWLKRMLPGGWALTMVMAIGLLYGSVTVAGAAAVNRAVAVVHPVANSKVSGTVSFTRVADGVKVSADFSGLTSGKHGFHIHQWGDCTAADGKSAGGHYNPGGYPHAGPNSAKRHMGDLGNLEADSSGRAHYERVDSHLKLDRPNSIVGRGIIVHAGEDDLTSQPSGAAGPRQACGVIGIAKP